MLTKEGATGVEFFVSGRGQKKSRAINGIIRTRLRGNGEKRASRRRFGIKPQMWCANEGWSLSDRGGVCLGVFGRKPPILKTFSGFSQLGAGSL